MTRLIARLAAGRAPARGDRLDHRAVFARFVEALAARSRAFGQPRIREV
jgi:hypothetical protein